MSRSPASVARLTLTELVKDSTAVGSPVTLLAGMFAGSTVDISVSCSSVVNGRSPSSHCSLVTPAGWLTQALPHESATSSAAGAGGADSGVSVSVVILVGRLLVVVVPVAPDVLVTGVFRVVVVPFAASAAAPRERSFEPVSCGMMMPAATTKTATTNTTTARWRGERIGQPHRRRYTAARPRLVRIGMSSHHRVGPTGPVPQRHPARRLLPHREPTR